MTLLIGLLTLGGILGSVGWMYSRRKESTKLTFDCTFDGVYFIVSRKAVDSCESVRLKHEDALVVASTYLNMPLEDVRKRMNGWTVRVRNEPSWDQNGMRVAGLTYHTDKLIIVGSDFNALGHEYIETISPGFHAPIKR